MANSTQALLAALNGFRSAQDRVARLPELVSLGREADSLDEVAEVVEDESESVENPAVLSALLRCCARLREELQQPQKAIVLWNDLLASLPDDLEALEALTRLLAAAKDLPHAAQVALRRARMENPGPERHARFLAAAELFVSARDPTSALAALDESLTQKVISDVGAIQLRRGKLLEDSKPTAAVAAYAQALAAAADEAAEGLMRLLTTPSARAAAAEVLEPVVRSRADVKALEEVLQARVETAAPELQARLLVELAGLREKGQEPRAALTLLLRAGALFPSDTKLRGELERLATALGARRELLASYEEWVQRAPNQADPSLLKRIAELHDELGNRAQAFESWEWAAEASPQDGAVLAVWAERCRQRGDLTRLARALRMQLAANPPQPARLELLRSLASLCEDGLADDVGAAHAYQELLDASPGDRKLLAKLARLYEQTRNASGLAAVLEAELALAAGAPPPERVALALRLARLKLAPPEDDARALELLREVLRLEPANAAAITALTELASAPGPAQAGAAALVAPALTAREDFATVAQLLEAQLAEQTVPAERAATLLRLSELRAGPLQEPELAFLAISRALRETPADALILKRTLELADKADANEEVEQLLSELAAAQTGTTRLLLLRTVAHRFDGRPASDEAISAWADVLAQVPNDEEAQARLDELFARADRLADLAVLWRQRVDAASPNERPPLLLKLAAAQERAGALDEAATTLLTHFAFTRGPEALAPLERVLGRLDRHLERAEALQRLAELAAAAKNETERTQRQVQQARALTLAGDPVRAVDVYAEVLERNPGEPRAVAELVALASDARVRDQAAELLATAFTGAGQRAERTAVLEVLVATPGLQQEARLRAELASLYEQQGALTQAFAGWLRLVREQPGDDRARTELERLALAGHLEEELLAAYEELLERTPPLERAVQAQLRATAARLQAGALQRPDLAIAAWEALARDGDTLEPLLALEPLYREQGDWPRLASVLERQAKLLPTTEAQLECLNRLAHLAEGPLQDSRLATEAYERILERAPTEPEAMRALGRLYAAAGRHGDAAGILERQLGQTESADLALEAGRLEAEHLGRRLRAVEHFATALRLRPDEAAVQALEGLLGAEPNVRARAAALLEPLYRSRNDAPRLAAALELQLPLADDARQVVLLGELSHLRETLGELLLAFFAQRELYARSPSPSAASELERLARASAQLSELPESLTARLAQTPGDDEALASWRQLARVRQELGDAAGAAAAWEQVASRTPDDAQPLVALTELYLSLQRYTELPRVLSQRAQLEPSIPRQAELLLQLAEVAETHLDDPTTAIGACRAVLERAADRRALPRLERLYERAGQFEALRELLVQQLEDAATPELQVRLALLEHRSLQDDGAALARLGSVLQAQHDHPEARAALEEVMRSGRPAAAQAADLLMSVGGSSALEVEALEVRLAGTWGDERTALFHRLADVHERSPESQPLAFDALARLLREQPDEARAFARLLALAAPGRFDQPLAALLTELMPRAVPETQVGFLRELAQVRRRLGDAAGELEALQWLLGLIPDELPALARLSALLQAALRWSELEGVLGHRYALATTEEEQVELLRSLAALQQDALEQPARAWETLWRLLELRPTDAAALARLDELCVTLQRWPELAEVLARRLPDSRADRSTLLLRLAKVRREKLGHAASALPLLGELLTAEPDNFAALGELEDLVEEQPGWEPASDLLLSAYRQGRDVEKLLRALETAATNALPGPRRRALWLELADLQLSRGGPALAFPATANAWREAPADAALRARLVTLADAASAHRALAAVFDEALPQLQPPEVAEVALSLATLCEEKLGEPARAATLYRAAMERVPQVAPRALAGLDRTLLALRRWDQLLPVLEAREQAAPEGPERVALLLRIAELASEELGLVDRAAEAWRAVLEREPHVGAARALEQVYERSGQLEPLRAILEKLLGLVSPVQQRQVRLKLAGLCAPTDPERSIALYRELLREEPLHAEAFARLGERFEAAGRFGELIELLQSRLHVTFDPQDAADLGFRIAQVTHRKLGDLQGAIAGYRIVLERVPRHPGALEALRELYENAGALPELAAVLAQLADSREAPPQRRAHQVRRVEVLALLGRAEEAATAARGALEFDERDDLEPELLRLRQVLLGPPFTPSGVEGQVLERLSKAQTRAGRATDAIATLLELTELELRRQNTEGATAALEQVLRLDPRHHAAWLQAEGLYAGAQQWKPWAALTAQFVEHLTGDERLTTMDRLAAVHAAQLSDLPGAFQWATQVVRLDPGSAARRRTAEELATKLGKLTELSVVYSQTLARLRFGPAHLELALALATLQDVQLDQVDAAEQTLKAILGHDRANASALDALVKMFERRALHERRAKALELKLEVTIDRGARVQLLEQLAQLHENELKNPAHAAAVLRRLMEVAPSAPHARLLAELHRRQKDWPRALAALLEVRSLTPKDEPRSLVQLELGALQERELKNPAAALEAYEEALELDPRSAEAFRALERLYLQLDKPVELLRTWERRLALPLENAETIELQYKSAELWERRGNPLNADRALKAIVELDGQQLRALEGLAKLRRAAGRWRPLAEILARLVEVITEPTKLAELCTEAGQVHLERLYEAPAAEKWWALALTHVPTHRPAVQALAELCLKESRWAEAVQFLTRQAQLESDPGARAQLEHRAGLVLEEKLKDLPGARAAWQRALKADELHLPALRRLRAAFFHASEWPEYEANLTHEATRAKSAIDRCAAAVELAAHFDQRARDPAQAITWYEHALGARGDALEAMLPLSDLLIAAQRWPRAVEVLHMALTLLDRESRQRPGERVRRLCQLGQGQLQLGLPRQALDTYGRAAQLDPTCGPALRGQVDALVPLGRHEEASQKLDLYLEQHGERLPRPQRAAAWLELAQLHWRLGRAQPAQTTGERALELEPQNLAALQVLIPSSDALASFEKSALYRKRLSSLVTGEERHTLLLELGAVLREKLASPIRAIDPLLQALQLKPDSRGALEQLLLAYLALGNKVKAAATQQTLVDLPGLTVAERRVHILGLADLVGRQLGDVERGTELLQKALDEAPGFTEALQALEGLLARARDWKKLAAAYERVIARHGEGAESAAARAALWRTLGELRLRKLDERVWALEAYEAGAELLPEDATAQEAFADLALTFPERTGDALEAYLRALPKSASVAKLCAAASQLAEATKDLDTAWLAARAAEVTGTATPQHKALLERLAPSVTVPPAFRAPLTDRGWRELLLHPLARGPVADVMATIFLPWAEKNAQDASEFGIHPKKHLIHPRTATHPALTELLLVGRQLGLEAPDLYSPYLAPQTSSRRQAHPDDSVGVKVLATFPPSVVVGEQQLANKDRVAQFALNGLSLAWLRPELNLALHLQPDALEVLFEAALTVGSKRYASKVEPKKLAAEVKRLTKALSSSQREALEGSVGDYLGTARPGDFARYLEGVMKTPPRVALLVCGDFAVVRTQLLPAGAAGESAMRELLDFALSGELRALREETASSVVQESLSPRSGGRSSPR